MRRIYIYLVLLSLSAGAMGQHPDGFACSGHDHFRTGRIPTQVKHPLLQNYDVSHYLVSLEVSDTSRYISGYTTISACLLLPADTLVFELNDSLRIDSVFVNRSRHYDLYRRNHLLFIRTSELQPENTHFTATIHYHGIPRSDGFFSGVSNRADSQWSIPVTYTLSEPFSARDWFPCKQVLTDKADSARIKITTPPGRMAGSNGLLQDVRILDDGQKEFDWNTRYPIAYYLLSFTVADFREYNLYAYPDGYDGPILIQNYIYNDTAYLSRFREDIDATAGMIELLSDLYSLYPFSEEKYGHCLAPMGGGMEHQTMTTLDNFNFDLVAHELGHQWFGDQVTCADWRDIWINEGFASYTEYLCREFLLSREHADDWMQRAHARAFSVPGGSIYLPEDEATDQFRIFSYALSYKKGAAIIHMLRHELDNDSLFFGTLRTFQQQYRDGVAVGEDFKEVLEVYSGRDFDWFFDQWYYGEGYPEFNITWWQDSGGLYLLSEQTGTSSGTPFFRTRMDFRLLFDDGSDTLLVAGQMRSNQEFKFRLEKRVESVVFDPGHWLLAKGSVTRKQPEQAGAVGDLVSINPNPFSDEITLEFRSRADRQIMITDLQGKVFSEFEAHDQLVTIPTRQLTDGMYMITINSGMQTYSTKVVKDR